MYKLEEVNRFSRGPNKRVKNRAFPVKNKRKFISKTCVGTIYFDVHVLTDGMFTVCAVTNDNNGKKANEETEGKSSIIHLRRQAEESKYRRMEKDRRMEKIL